MTVQSGGEQQSGAVLRQTGQTDVAVLVQQRGQTQTPAEAKHGQTQSGVGLFGRTLVATGVSGRPSHRLRVRLELEVRLHVEVGLVLGDVRQQIQLRDGVKGGQHGGEGGGGWGEWEHEERLNDRMQCAWQKDMVECAGKEKGREKHNISQ